jgi:hypothetical protein
MYRLFGALSVFLAALANVGTVASAQDAFVTRIEPRSYYGATITIEEGVRVFRPLPPTRQIIINPTQTPLNLSYSETVERRYASDASSGEANGNGNGYASNGNGDSGSSNDVTTSYPNYGSALSYGDDSYRRRVNGDSTSGRRLRGFGHHGVRVNGEHSGYDNGYAPSHGRSKGKSHGQALTAFGQPHRNFKSAPGHMPPTGYRAGYGARHPGFANSSGYHGSNQTPSRSALGGHMPMQNFKMQNFKVQRTQPMRPATPIVTHVFRPSTAPHHVAMPTAPRTMHAPVSAPRPHAAPQHGGHGHAAPAGRMGMGGGMGGGMGMGRR